MNRLGMTVVVIFGLLMGRAVFSQEAATQKTTLSAGLTLTEGNSETLQANLAVVSEGEKDELGSYRAGIEANYGESTIREEKEQTLNNARAFAQIRKTLTDRLFGYLDGSVLHDDQADLAYRATLGPGLGVYLLKNDVSSLSLEAGVAYVWEEVADTRDDYLALRFAQRLDVALSDTARLWQSAEYRPKADDFGDYLLNAELGVEAAMTSRLNLRVVLQNKYDQTPAADREKNDLALITGFSFAL
ncbi:MAG: DUF481 domain-containing protein [Kiritimatiellia bacterium]|nr:DUF481 domain-containing protein [Kiritimatiellia bacterium]